MDPSWMREPRSSTLFLKGLGEFLDLECKNYSNGREQIKCPCVKCAQSVWVTRDKATEHVICNGIMEGFYAKYLQFSKELVEVGIWGTTEKGSPHNQWNFRLENNHKLKKISIDHGDLIFSLKFTTKDDEGCLHETKKAGGWNGGNRLSEVTLDDDEEITGITGTVAKSRGTYAGYTIISSLSFITNKRTNEQFRTHGPFGEIRGTHFEVPWRKGSFAGFYGLAGYYIDGIGVYLRASIYTPPTYVFT